MCTCVAFHQSAFSCASSGRLIVLLYIHTDCNGTDFPWCACWYAFWGWKDHCMNSCTGCTCAASPRCEWGSEFSNGYSEQMTCYTLDNCTSWPHCGSACGWKGFAYLQMSSDTHHKIIFLASSRITSYPFRISAPTAVNHKKLKYRSKHHFPFHKHQNSWHFLSITIEQDWDWGRPPSWDFLITKRHGV